MECTVSINSSINARPLAPHESNLPQIEVEHWLQIDKGDVFLEAPAFDRQGNLCIMAAYDQKLNRRILKISTDKKIEIILKNSGIRMCGAAIHKDGRIFIGCLTGELLTINGDGSHLSYVTPRYQGKPQSINDLTFDSRGYLYATDFIGHPGNPTGGVYRFSPDMQTIEPIYQHITSANGIAFSPDGRGLWVSASHANEIFYLEFGEDKLTLRGMGVPYRLSGMGGGDGLRVDQMGNMYLAINLQGRVLIFNKDGIPIAHVLMPGRENNRLIRTTNLAFKPGSDEVFLLVSDETGAWIYKFRGLAPGLALYSHQ
jgi:lactonase